MRTLSQMLTTCDAAEVAGRYVEAARAFEAEAEFIITTYTHGPRVQAARSAHAARHEWAMSLAALLAWLIQSKAQH